MRVDPEEHSPVRSCPSNSCVVASKRRHPEIVGRTARALEKGLRQKIEVRLAELRNEARMGSQRLQELRSRCAELQETMARIDGAIMVLEELLANEEETDPKSEAPSVLPLRPA